VRGDEEGVRGNTVFRRLVDGLTELTVTSEAPCPHIWGTKARGVGGVVIGLLL
jgi:hypothetical protein